jgi:outer membrane protein TolC
MTKGMTARLVVFTALSLFGASVIGADYQHTIDAYLAEGRSSNLSLLGQDQEMVRARAALDEARAQYLPSIALKARYTRSEGGRTLALPVGDLVNPAYQTLNQLLLAQGQPAPFSNIENQEIALLRSREQDTRVSLSQVIYAPAIAAGIRGAEYSAQASEAARAALMRTLERDIEVAYLNWLRAREAVAIVESSRDLLNENLRVNRVLFDNGKLTQDQVLRAQAEVLSVEQQLLDTGNAITLAQSYFNFLLNRPLDAPIAAAETPDPQMHAAQALATIGGIEDLQYPALERQARKARAEIDQLEAGARAASALVDVERASFAPTIGFGLDLGIQGEDYGFGSGRNFAAASVVLDWTIFDFGRRRARVSGARANAERAQLKRDEVAQQISLEVRQSSDRLATGLASLATAAARREAAAEAFRIAARKRDAGSIAQVEFIDARNALTSAELNQTLTRFEVLVRLAELRAAVALPASAG